MKTKTRVRLNKNYISTIKRLAKKYFDAEEVRIFGSRADLNKKGGDLDIYIKTGKTKDILKLKIAFLREFEKIHGEQKVDLLIETTGNKVRKIHKIAKTTGIKL